MTRTRAPFGNSLVTTYDTEGGMLAAESELRDDEIVLVDDLGQRTASERFHLSIRQMNSGDVAQSTAFDSVIDDLPSFYRILNVIIWAETTVVAADITSLALFQRDPTDERDIPIWSWLTADGVMAQRFQPNNSLVLGSYAIFTPSAIRQAMCDTALPSLGRNHAQLGGNTRAIALRGTTAAFGAGTKKVFASILIGHVVPAPGLDRVDGTPIFSW